jgi:hypothetical protein
VGGKPWKPKHLKLRVVPLTPSVRASLENLRERVPGGPEDLVEIGRGWRSRCVHRKFYFLSLTLAQAIQKEPNRLGLSIRR